MWDGKHTSGEEEGHGRAIVLVVCVLPAVGLRVDVQWDCQLSDGSPGPVCPPAT